MSIAAWIRQWAETDRVAIHFEGTEVTYAQLHHRIETTAKGLVASGVGPGDRIGFCGLNRVELFEGLFAAARIGAIFVPFNNRLAARELAAQINDSAPAILLATDGFDSLLSQATEEHLIRNLDADPFTASDSMLDAEPDEAEAPVLMMYTSGTTGQAKGAMLSQDAMLHTVLNSIDCQGIRAEDFTVAPLPTFHVGGLNIQTLPTLYVGGQVLLQRRFNPTDVLDGIVRYRATQILLVPAMLNAVAAHPAFAESDLTSLRGITSGSSVVPDDVMRPFFDRNIPVGQVYGATETGPTAVVLGFDDAAANIGSCGKPARHTELRIVDGDQTDVGPGTPGELWLRGPNIFSGYWRNPTASADAFADDGWFRTGDMGYLTAEGYVFISDRITDVVISGGENVYPAEIEPVLEQHPAIAEATVIGASHEQWGEVPVLVAVLEPDASLTIDELRAWCDDRIARFKQPRELHVVDELPRTALGKVKKHELRK